MAWEVENGKIWRYWIGEFLPEIAISVGKFIVRTGGLALENS